MTEKELALRLLLRKIRTVLLTQYAFTRSAVDAELIADITAALSEPKAESREDAA